MAMSVAYFFVYGFEPIVKLMCVVAAASMLVALALYDFKHKLLPNQMMIVLAVLGLVYRFVPLGTWEGKVTEYLGGAVLYATISFFLGWVMKLLLKKSALGMGTLNFSALLACGLGL